MAAPTYATDLSNIIEDMASSSGWTLISSGGGGANSFTVPETDDYIQGNNCISRSPWSSSIRGMVYNSSQTIAAGEAVFLWVKADVAQALATKASGGVQCLVGSGTGDLKCYYTDGNDTYQFGGWRCIPIDPTVTASTTVGSPTSTTSYFGCRWNVPSSGPSKGYPFKIDAIRHGRELQITNGDGTSGYATFTGVATYQGDLTRQWGLFQAQTGGYLQQGLFLMGTSGTAVDFRDSNRVISIANTEYVGANFNTFEVRNASSRVDWTNISITALGTVSKGRFVTTNDADINMEGCTFTDMNTFGFLANSTINGTTFRRCALITTGGATFSGCLVDNSTATIAMTASSPANAALISNTDFVSDGTGHGLEITGTAANITLTNLSWTGYAGSDGSTGNEAVYVNIGSGSMNLTISGGTTPSIRTAGCSVTVVSGAVDVTAHAIKEDGTDIQSARVHLEADTGGPFPAGATVTIANSGTTATVTHTSHGLATNDKVVIRGASHDANNGVFQITVTNSSTYTYTMGSSPGSSPTGTITSTFVVLNGLTDANGEITMSRVFPSNQPVTGRVRKSSSAPYFKSTVLSGEVSSSAGATLTGVMISDD